MLRLRVIALAILAGGSTPILAQVVETYVPPDPAGMLRPKLARINSAFGLALELPDTTQSAALARYCDETRRRLSTHLASAVW